MLAIDGFEIDVPDSKENATEFGYAGSGGNRSAFPEARVVALAECGTHAFLAAEVDAYSVGSCGERGGVVVARRALALTLNRRGRKGKNKNKTAKSARCCAPLKMTTTASFTMPTEVGQLGRS